VKDGTTDGLFCTNCHDLTQAEVHMMWRPMPMRSIACVECHVAVPHGSPVSRLIGYEQQLKMRGFKWNDVNNNRDAYAPSCGGGFGCHNTNAGGYDTYP